VGGDCCIFCITSATLPLHNQDAVRLILTTSANRLQRLTERTGRLSLPAPVIFIPEIPCSAALVQWGFISECKSAILAAVVGSLTSSNNFNSSGFDLALGLLHPLAAIPNSAQG